MTTTPGGCAQPQLRASDADRDLVLAELSSSFEVGRLTSEEFDERTSRALASRTMGELAALTADLPPGRQAGPPAQPPAPAGPGFPPRQVRLPVIAVVAVVAIAAIVLGAASVHAWWLLIIPLIIARGAAMRRRGHGGGPFRREWP